jgi:hypothetical protein
MISPKQIFYETTILNSLENKYIEHIEDRGVLPEEILVTLLAKAYIEIEELKNRVREYENTSN